MSSEIELQEPTRPKQQTKHTISQRETERERQGSCTSDIKLTQHSPIGTSYQHGAAIILNGKTRRVSVCNALDCVIINEKRLADLPFLCAKLADKNVIIYADVKSYSFLDGHYPAQLLKKATEESFGTEFQDYKIAIKTVSDINEAIDHISRYSSKHSEAIVSENEDNINLFDKVVDAACVYTNTPTSWTDGAQFGLGAEIGISTQKLHARGPMALEELTSYKWIVKGNGQVRS